MLIIVVGIKNVELGMYLFGGMGAKFQLAVYQVLQHLEHSVFHLFRIVRLLNVLPYEVEGFVFHFLFSSKEQFSLLCGAGDVFVNINANQNAHLVDAIEKWAQGKIA